MSAAQQNKQGEPSMEEILASIRQIISDEQAPPKPAPQPARQADAAIVMTPPSLVMTAPKAIAEDDDILDLISPQTAQRSSLSPEQSFAALNQAVTADRIMSRATNESVSAQFGNLAHTVLSQNARTLDDIVLELLRPMLKHWLDDNLPPIVERLVRAEIERVARGGR